MVLVERRQLVSEVDGALLDPPRQRRQRHSAAEAAVGVAGRLLERRARGREQSCFFFLLGGSWGAGVVVAGSDLDDLFCCY